MKNRLLLLITLACITSSLWAQNVGVGTASPFYKLDVDGTLGVPRTHRLQFYEPGTGNARAFISSSNIAPFNELIFGVGASVEAMRIIPNGNLGIGVTDPSARLHVNGSVRFQTILNGYLKVDANGNVSSVSTIPATDITGLSQSKWTQSGSNLYPNSSAWNTGLGTTIPSAKLDIVNSGSGGAGIVGLGEHLRIAALAPNIKFVDVSADTDSFAIHLNQNIMSIGKITGASTMRNDIVIGSTGNVGVGTASPSVKMEVEGGNLLIDGGNIRINDVTAGNGQGFTAFGNSRLYVTAMGSAPTAHDMLFGTAYDNDRVVGLRYTPGTTGASAGVLAIGQQLKNNANFTHGITTFHTNGLERMRIASNGNVGVGTTNPLKIFHVAGTSTTAIMRLQNTSAGVEFISQDMAGFEIVAAGMNASAAKYTPAIKFSSTDPQFTTLSPKFLAGIVGRATETYSLDETGGMALDFLTSSNTPGVSSVPDVRMSIFHNGNVGIGITNPGQKLYVKGNILAENGASTSGTVRNAGFYNWTDASYGMELHHNGSNWGLALFARSTDSDIRLGHYAASATAQSALDVKMTIKNSGNVGIGLTSPTYKLHVSGQIKSDGITESSDIRLKKDISNLKDALQKVMQLQGVSYAWKTQQELDAENISYTASEANKEEIGLLAQEVEKILPQVVNTDNEGFKSIEYSKLVALLIEAIKEQQLQMNTLKAENVQLKNYAQKTDKLEAELSVIKSFIFQQSQR